MGAPFSSRSIGEKVFFFFKSFFIYPPARTKTAPLEGVIF